MRRVSAARTPDVIGHDGSAPSNATVVVVSCSRIGMTANPPRLTLADWFRRRR